jgi:hypothetical protein
LAIPKAKSSVSVPWDVLNSTARSGILDNPLPFVEFKSLDPMRASTSDIYGVLSSILVEQKKGQRPLKFSIDRETLHCLSTDQEKAMKELMVVNSSTVDSLPQPKPAHSKEPRKSNQAASAHLDGDLFDFSPNIPGNVTPGPPTTPRIVPDSKLSIYT